MDLVFVSNFMNHHQMPLCQALVQKLGVDAFRFVAMEPFDNERLKAGYDDLNAAEPWIVRGYETSEEELDELISSARIALLDPQYRRFTSLRAQQGSITFLISERILKRGKLWRLFPLKALRTYTRYNRWKRSEVYILCNSAYAADDFELCGFPRSKCYRWGYFISVARESEERPPNDVPRILWLGRMLGLKHGEIFIQALGELKRRGVPFAAEMIGEGEKREDWIGLSEELSLQDRLRFSPSIKNEAARRAMRKADIFVATSDFHEGWGAVVSEALAESCAVVASRAMGSVPYLVQDGYNGFTYDWDQCEELAHALEALISDPALLANCRLHARQRMCDTYSPEVASERLLVLADALQKGSETPFADGPCSRA